MAGKPGNKKRKFKLSAQHATKLGTMNIMKGSNNKGEVTYTWDAVQTCRLHTCPAASRCHYLPELREGDECKIMKKYLRSVSLVMYEAQGDMTSAQRFQVGMHIIPLYKTLCKMKIEEVGIVDAVSMTSRGTMQVNPIYKEMREIIKVIDSVWKSIGVKADAPKMAGFDKMDSDGAKYNYYDKMEKDAFAQMDNVTPIKGRKK